MTKEEMSDRDAFLAQFGQDCGCPHEKELVHKFERVENGQEVVGVYCPECGLKLDEYV